MQRSLANVDSHLVHLLNATGASEREKGMITALAGRLREVHADGLAEKLAEYRGRRVEALVAELRMASALSGRASLGVELRSGAAHDLRLRGQGVDWTVEVQHKSTIDPFSAVFYPEPDVLAAYERAPKAWQTAAWKLHAALRELPFEVQPWVSGDLSAPRWSWQEREHQEEACGQLAEWLVEKLAALPRGGNARLSHDHARFDVRPISAPPGRVRGAGPLSAFILNDQPTGQGTSLLEWLRDAVLAKSKKAAGHPDRSGALHFVGLVVDDAFACTGHPLSNALLGGLNSELPDPPRPAYSSRGVPKSARPLIAEAIERGRGELLRAMAFDPLKNGAGPDGAIFDEVVRRHIDGVLALYYTGHLHFIPNPFSPRDIDRVWAFFPRTIAPFESR